VPINATNWTISDLTRTESFPSQSQKCTAKLRKTVPHLTISSWLSSTATALNTSKYFASHWNTKQWHHIQYECLCSIIKLSNKSHILQNAHHQHKMRNLLTPLLKKLVMNSFKISVVVIRKFLIKATLLKQYNADKGCSIQQISLSIY